MCIAEDAKQGLPESSLIFLIFPNWGKLSEASTWPSQADGTDATDKGTDGGFHLLWGDPGDTPLTNFVRDARLRWQEHHSKDQWCCCQHPRGTGFSGCNGGEGSRLRTSQGCACSSEARWAQSSQQEARLEWQPEGPTAGSLTSCIVSWLPWPFSFTK